MDKYIYFLRHCHITYLQWQQHLCSFVRVMHAVCLRTLESCIILPESLQMWHGVLIIAFSLNTFINE